MSRFSRSKRKHEEADFDDFTALLFPYIQEDIQRISGHAEAKEESHEPAPEERNAAVEEIGIKQSEASPLSALRRRMYSDTEIAEDSSPADRVISSDPPQKDETAADMRQPKPSDRNTAVSSPDETEPKPAKTTSLLAKCMPYIYDDNGVNCAEEKPDYTLESVEEIINSAERRAKEKIARLYNLKYDAEKKELVQPDANDIAMKPAEKTAPEVQKAPAPSKPAAPSEIRINDDKISLPTEANTLFDDFSGKRTVLTPTENITTAYSKLVELQNGTGQTEDKTRILPALHPQSDTKEIYEDIVSHTKPINIKDAPGVKPSAVKAPILSGTDDPVIEVDDYLCAADAKRIGVRLKRQRRSAYLKLAATAVLTAASAVFHLPFLSDFVTDHTFAVSISCFVIFCIAAAVNLDIFASFKTAFTKRMTVAFPVALGCTAMAVYLIWGFIAGIYPFDAAILSLVSLLFYDYFRYRKANAVLNNFKLVAARREKQAVVLIDDQNVTASMARSAIEGDILAAGSKRTAEITDFLKHTLSDTAFGGHLPAVTLVFCILAAVTALAVGISYQSAESALCALASVLCLAAMPTLPIADLLPVTGISGKLNRKGAAVCGKFSAGKIEQINAAVINSSELFPDGCIELYNIQPLCANNIDETLIEAAAVAAVIKSPLEPVFRTIVSRDAEIPCADSVKYEDNLGLSGWVGDHHLLIGNRTLMESHGVRVPSLEVDRKILHKGYFPVYLACDQRACALLIVKYRADEEIADELNRLIGTGVTLLIHNCDPNITEEMLCDYYSFYPDGIKIMDHIGTAKYKNAVNYSETCSAHAFSKGGILAFASIITSCIRLRTMSGILYALHLIGAVVACLLFAFLSLNGSLSLMNASVCLVLELICFVISLTGYFASRP